MKNNSWLIVLVLVVLAGGAYMYRHQLRVMLMGAPAPVTQTTGTSPTATGTQTTGTSPTATGNPFFMTKTDTAKGDYLADPNGMTLYSFDKDSKGVSNCTGTCATLWPPYAMDAAPSILPANVTTFTRADGTIQFAYNGKPVYNYTPDKAVGDVTGDGVGGVWHLVKP